LAAGSPVAVSQRAEPLALSLTRAAPVVLALLGGVSDARPVGPPSAGRSPAELPLLLLDSVASEPRSAGAPPTLAEPVVFALPGAGSDARPVVPAPVSRRPGWTSSASAAGVALPMLRKALPTRAEPVVLAGIGARPLGTPSAGAELVGADGISLDPGERSAPGRVPSD
jgi:hypothetical protein